MSDTPRGDDWWQASDHKWYPPQPSTLRRWVLPAAAIVLVGIVAGAVAFVATSSGDDEDDLDTVLMEPVATAGPDPFTPSVALDEVAEFPEPVAAVVTEAADELRVDSATGTLTATGDTPGLYGGTGDEATCDPDALIAHLSDVENADTATAFASARGIDVDDLPTHLDRLTPVLLTLDTRVTNHGYRDGRATPRQSVLQAGTAVLVDDLGQPVVRCSCGNPLADPEPIDLTTVATTGTTWTTWSPARTASPVPAPAPQTTFTLVDTTTGATYQHATGPADATNWIAVGGGGAGPDVELPGSIHRSEDGVEWEQVFDSDGAIHGVAHGNGVYVAVGFTGGTMADGRNDEVTGYVHTSTDGTDWTGAEPLPIPAEQVAFGNGTFVAVSDHEAVVSDDGTNWSDPITLWEDLGYGEYGAVSTITFGDGTFLAFKHRCAANCHWARPFPLVSEDGATWEKEEPGTESAATPYGSLDLMHGVTAGFNGTFGTVGRVMLEGSTQMNQLSEPTSARLVDGTWQLAPITAMGEEIRRLGTANGSWVAVTRPQGTQSRIIVSDDLTNWNTLATLDTALNDVLVVGQVEPEPAPVPEADDPEPASTAVELTEAGFRVEGEEYSTASSPASAARAALTTVLGEPGSATPIGGGVCEPGMYRWGELEFTEFSESFWYFSLDTADVDGDSVAERVRTDGDVGLGDPIDAFRSAHPSTSVIETDWGGTAYWADSVGNGRGLLAFASDGGTVSFLSGGAEDPTDLIDC